MTVIARRAHTIPEYPVIPGRLPPIPETNSRTTPIVYERTQRTPKGVQEIFSAAQKPVKVVYGYQRIGGEIIWVGRAPFNTWVFHIRWCWGEIWKIHNIKLADKALPGGATVANYIGTTTQPVDPTLSSIIPGFTDNLVANINGQTRGIAHSVVQIPYDQISDSIAFTAEVDGMVVIDTRTSSPVFTTNPALHANDFMTSRIYGPGWAVDSSSIDTVADMNDELVSGQPRYESNMVIDQLSDAHSYAQIMAQAAGAFLLNSQGLYKLVPNRPATSLEIFDLRKISIDRSEVVRPIQRQNAPNVVRVFYTFPTSREWAEEIEEVKTPEVAAGTQYPRVATLRASYIHKPSVARRLATETLNGGILPRFDVSWLHSDDGVRLERGDVITLDRIPGFTGPRDVRVLRKDMVKASGGYYWRINARHYDPGEFSDDVAPDPVEVLVDVDDPTNPTAVDDLTVIEYPWQDASGHYQTQLQPQWTGVNHAQVLSYRVHVSTDSGTTLLDEFVVAHKGAGQTHDATSSPVEVGKQYTVEVWSISSTGNISAVASWVITATGDALGPPATPTGLTATERLWVDQSGVTNSAIDLNWDRSTDPWVRSYRVQMDANGLFIHETTVTHMPAPGTMNATVRTTEFGVSHNCRVWAVNVEGDVSAAFALTTITPLGRVAPPNDVSGFTAIENRLEIELQWDDVLTTGDIGYRLKRGSNTDTWATASELDIMIYANAVKGPTVYYEDRNVGRGRKRYFIKAIGPDTLESDNDAVAPIFVRWSKGAYANQHPSLPLYASDQGQIIYSDASKFFTNVSTGGRMGNSYGFSVGTSWDTVFEDTGTGFLGLCAVGARNLDGNTHFISIRVIIDDVTIILRESIPVPGPVNNELGIVVVGHEVFISADKLVCHKDDYMPWSNNIKIEAKTSSLLCSTHITVRAQPTIAEHPPSRPLKTETLQNDTPLGYVAGVGPFTTIYDYLLDDAGTGMQATEVTSGTGWVTIMSFLNFKGMLMFVAVAGKNVSAETLNFQARITLDGQERTYTQSLTPGDQAAMALIGNIVFNSDDEIADLIFGRVPYDFSMKVEMKADDAAKINILTCRHHYLG